MDRDPKTGRFLPGNQAAKGNKGNTYPKWGNENAMKHGLFCSYQHYKIIDGYLYIARTNRIGIIRIPPGCFEETEDGVLIHGDLTEELRNLGVRIQ